jgi:uncharacterized protein CbrC (UPF0167 family)
MQLGQDIKIRSIDPCYEGDGQEDGGHHCQGLHAFIGLVADGVEDEIHQVTSLETQTQDTSEVLRLSTRFTCTVQS